MQEEWKQVNEKKDNGDKYQDKVQLTRRIYVTGSCKITLFKNEAADIPRSIRNCVHSQIFSTWWNMEYTCVKTLGL